jgi:hypothetical protein
MAVSLREQPGLERLVFREPGRKHQDGKDEDHEEVRHLSGLGIAVIVSLQHRHRQGQAAERGPGGGVDILDDEAVEQRIDQDHHQSNVAVRRREQSLRLVPEKAPALGGAQIVPQPYEEEKGNQDQQGLGGAPDKRRPAVRSSCLHRQGRRLQVRVHSYFQCKRCFTNSTTLIATHAPAKPEPK